MARVVQFAGGWLFDRVMAGWDVTVHVTDHADTRPLQILGARACDLERTLASAFALPLGEALAVDADLYGSDVRVRRMVLAAVSQGSIDIRVWGDGCAVSPDGEAVSVCHRLSVAARAFKAQALAAVATQVGPIDVTEEFRSNKALAARELVSVAAASVAPRPRSKPRSDVRQPVEVV